MQPRRRLIVLSHFQKWFLLHFLIYLSFLLGTIFVGFILWYRIVFSEFMAVAGIISGTFLQIVEQKALLGMGILGLISFFIFLMTCAHALVFSRKIAGPLYSLARHFDRCQENERLEHLELRKGDLFRDLVERFNQMADKVGQSKSS